MPGSPDRVLLRNPNVTTEVRDAAPRALGPRQAALPGPVRHVSRGDGPGRPRLLVPVPGPAGHRRPRRAGSGRPSSCSASASSSRSSSGSASARTRAGDAAASSTTSATAHRWSSIRCRTSSSACPCCVIFATGLGWFPTYGHVRRSGEHVRRPSAASSATSPGTSSCRWRPCRLGLIGQYSILMRSSVIETLGEDYVTTARAKGLTDGARPARPRPAQRAAADGHAHRDQPRLRHRRRDHGRGRLQLAGPRDADGRRRSPPATIPVLQGIFLLLCISVVAANLVADIVYGRPRPAGPGMTRARRPARRARAPGRPPAAWLGGQRDFWRQFARRRDGLFGRRDPDLLLDHGHRPAAVRRAARDRHDGFRRPARRRRRPRTSSAPTSSAATSST